MRKDIVIEVKTPSKQYEYVDFWERLDTYQDQKMTLQYISNLLTGIDSITSSSSLSIKLPRTVHNERIFDLATRPQYDSAMTHRKIDCRVYINGIDMMKEAFCYLLDSESDSYEIAIVFGLLQAYSQWLTDRPGLRDLQERGEFIIWNAKCAVDCNSVWWSNYPSLYTSVLGLNGHNFASQFYALYDCGLGRDNTTLNYFNLHPCVTLREIYERIIAENNLNFNMPISVLRDMEELAIVQVERNQPEVGEPHPTAASPNASDDVYASGYGKIQAKLGGLCGRIDLPTSDYYKTKNSIGYWLYYGEGAVTIDFDFKLQPLSSDNKFGQLFKWLVQFYHTLDYICLVIYDYTTNKTYKFTPQSYGTSQGVVNNVRFKGTHTITKTENLTEGATMAEMALWIDPRIQTLDPTVSNILAYYFNQGGLGGGNSAFVADGVQQLDVRYSFDLANGFQYTYLEGTIPYPNEFQLIQNLPDISQLDFIKAICQMYCLFPVVEPSSQRIDFAFFDSIEGNTMNAYDWSDKLLEYSRDVPKKISFRLGDYARNNIVKYRDDENEKYPFHSEAILQIDDDTLDKEKTIIEFPWAATKVNKITQYQIKPNEDGQQQRIEYEFIQCEYRLVRITEWQRQSDCANVAQFQDIDAEYILATYYNTYQGAIRKPRIITEHIRLNELEMRDIEFRNPVYLRKYGCFFAIKQIQWTAGDDYAEVELLQLESTVGKKKGTVIKNEET